MDEPVARRPGASPLSELASYYLLVGTYFFAFGMQFVLYPSLVTFVLHESPERVGLAQMAISAPMFALLLVGGLLAERAQPGPSLALLQIFFAIASLALSFVIANGWLTYSILIGYAVFAGAFAAFVMPIRDAALNGVLTREAAQGRTLPIAKAAAATTAVQIGAQIAGIAVASAAGANPAPFVALQALCMAIAAGVALLLRAPKPTGHERSFSGALRDVGAGLAYAFSNKVMAPMLISAAYAGVFIVGSFQVLFPLIVRDSYGGDTLTQGGRLSTLLAAFWGASFVSAILSRIRPPRRPGRAMIISHIIGALVLLTFALHKPFWAFIAIVMVWGFAAGIAISTSRAIVQSVAEPGFLGRVLSVYSMGFMGGAPIGSLIVGFAAGEFGARSAALIPGIGLLIAAIALAALTPLWTLRHSTAPQDNG